MTQLKMVDSDGGEQGMTPVRPGVRPRAKRVPQLSVLRALAELALAREAGQETGKALALDVLREFVSKGGV